MDQPETRASLIVKLQGERNEQAWVEFVAAYEPFLRRLVQRQGVPQRHVGDVVQHVLAAIAHSVSQWQDDGSPASFRRWTGRVARNVVLKFMVRERRQLGGRGGTDLIDQLHQVPDRAFSDEENRRYEYELIVWAAEQVRSEFRATSWRAFWATLVEGRSVADVARELQLSPGGIYMARSRVMAKIQSKIREVLAD
jgi:RNA polymerase sigma-70 factor (ECF subfamily)